MKRWIAFAIVVILGIAALVWSERHPVEVRVTPASLLYFIADSEWELSRLPMAATRLSDQEEIDIGNQMAANIFLDRFGSQPDAGREAAGPSGARLRQPRGGQGGGKGSAQAALQVSLHSGHGFCECLRAARRACLHWRRVGGADG